MNVGSVTVTITRTVDELCPRCHGSGEVLYGSTSTWRGGIGGCAMTSDVCDHCWGSGDIAHPWANLREAAARNESLAERKAADMLDRALGVGLYSLWVEQHQLANEIARIGRKRTATIGMRNICDYLSQRLHGFSTAGEERSKK